LQSGRSQSTSFPSKLILVIGGLGMLWLILAGLLIIQLDDEIGFPASHAMAAIASSPWSGETPAAARILDAPDEPEEVGDSIEVPIVEAALPGERAREAEPSSVVTAPRADAPRAEIATTPAVEHPMAAVAPQAVPAHTHIPRSLLDVHDEPLPVELQVLFETVMVSLAEGSEELDPALVRQASALAARMNSEGQSFTVRFHDPIVDLARRRAVNGHLFLVDLGLRPWLLETAAQNGRAGVSVHKIN
jgi:hypothetical protein